jgi:hypothetical protein
MFTGLAQVPPLSRRRYFHHNREMARGQSRGTRDGLPALLKDRQALPG